VIRAVLDTNVLASGFVGFDDARRAPAGLLRLWRDKQFELVVSAEILMELLDTFQDPYFRRRLTPEQLAEAERLVREEATWATHIEFLGGVATHPEDDLVLGAAVGAGVDCLVTGDVKLQRIGAYRGVRILSPRAFFDELTGTDQAV
jgi:uncharacterized protein